MTKFHKIAAFVCASFMAAPAAMAAPIMIDDFDVFQRVVDTPFNVGEVNNSVTPGIEPSILGGVRFMEVSTTPTSNGGTTLTSTGPNGTGFNPPSTLKFTNDGNQTGVATVSYGIVAGGVALGDLTGMGVNDKFFFDVLEDTPNFDGTTLKTTVISAGGATATVTEDLDLFFSEFTSFSLFAGVDFTQVESLIFTFDTNDLTGFDANLSSISVVPLPASALLLLGGLGGLAAFGKRRRSKVA